VICAEFLSTAAGDTERVSKRGGARRIIVLAATAARNLGATWARCYGAHGIRLRSRSRVTRHECMNLNLTLHSSVSGGGAVKFADPPGGMPNRK